MTKRERFEKARADYLLADQALHELESALRIRYGKTEWAGTTEKKRIAQLHARKDRLSSRIFALLDKTPRDWRSGVPAHWIASELSWEDAHRPLSEPLSVVPPPAYGRTEDEMIRFASARSR